MSLRETDQFFRTLKSSNSWAYGVENDILWVPGTRLVYTSCSKNACSHIKDVLAKYLAWPATYEGSPHRRANTGLIGLSTLEDPAKIVSLLRGPESHRVIFSRNPFARAASAYFNRVEHLGLQSYDSVKTMTATFLDNRRRILAWKYDQAPELVDPGERIAFADFIRFICQQDPYEMDRHWYFQRRTMHLDQIDYTFIGRVETLDADLERVIRILPPKAGFEFARERLNSSRSVPLEDLFTLEVERLFAQVFAEDFETFHYSDRIKRSATVRGATIASERATPPVSVKLPSILDFVIVGAKYADDVRASVRSIREHLGSAANIVVLFEGSRTTYDQDLARIYDLAWHADATPQSLPDAVKRLPAPHVMVLDAGMSIIDSESLGYGMAFFGDAYPPPAVGGFTRTIYCDRNGVPVKTSSVSGAGYLPSRGVEGNLLTVPVEYTSAYDRSHRDTSFEVDFLGGFAIFNRAALLNLSESIAASWTGNRLDKLAFFEAMKSAHTRAPRYLRKLGVERRVPLEPAQPRYSERSGVPAAWLTAPPAYVAEAGVREYYYDRDRGDYVSFAFRSRDVVGNTMGPEAVLANFHPGGKIAKVPRRPPSALRKIKRGLIESLKNVYRQMLRFPAVAAVVRPIVKLVKRGIGSD
jgi:hypothetical protein